MSAQALVNTALCLVVLGGLDREWPAGCNLAGRSASGPRPRRYRRSPRTRLRVGSGDRVLGDGDIELGPHAVAVPADDPTAYGRFLIVADGQPIAGLRVEGGVGGPRAVRDPALDNEVRPDSRRVVSPVVSLRSRVHQRNRRSGPAQVGFG